MTDNSKRTNNEIVKSLIVITQDFFNHYGAASIVIDELNLVANISNAMHAYRRQRDRITDLHQDMARIVEGK